ncbi:MAG: membrane protein insertion efficiency factor YidD [Candidatus Cloacimonadota bacterium]|jgi:putative membrane protein insertion efficiency factor|nr:membrane protein insertion efficiency factor YidD [Candidatus Cloacimonadota bacterium]NMD13429.1 membrane protein insertion efficiency factor YidD [Candidatus Cloacimonadota bacterium]
MQRTGLNDGKSQRSVLNRILRLPNLAVILLISIYRKSLSRILPRVCRFEPSCSSYGLQAFRKFNFFKALGLTLWRVLRCNPFCRGGYDPLP